MSFIKKDGKYYKAVVGDKLVFLGSTERIIELVQVAKALKHHNREMYAFYKDFVPS